MTAYLGYHIDLSGTEKKTLPQPITIPPKQYVRAHVSLAYLTEHAAGAGANCYIAQYVKDGVAHDGPVRLLIEYNVTEIVFGMEVWNSDASEL
jgi:hypothetical protein